MTVHVLQPDLSRLWEQKQKSSFMFETEMFTGADVLELIEEGEYIHVADLATSDLNEAFEIGNIGPEEKYTRFARMHSVSVGDVLMIDQDPNIYVVAKVGFVNLGLPKTPVVFSQKETV